MANLFKKIFSKSDESVIGVDIGPSSIKIVQLKKKKGKAVLETYGALALGPYAGIEVGRATQLPPEKISEALIDLMKEANITSRDAGLSIPMSASLVNIIEVPDMNEKKLAEIIPIEARKYIPIPISEVMLDWWVIPKEQSGRSQLNESTVSTGLDTRPRSKLIAKAEVLLVVIHKDAIEKIKTIVAGAKINFSFVEIEIFSAIRSILEREVSPVMIFDLGASSTKLYIIDKGILRVSHIINRGSQEMTISLSKSLAISVNEAESLKRSKGLIGESQGPSGSMTSTLNYIFSEANRVILNYQKKYYKNITRVILNGGGVGMKGLFELAKNNFQVEVEFANPFVKVESPAFLGEVLSQIGPEFSTAVGLALRKLQEKE